ncbi:MAG TPA: NHLP leader peptide family RiPP precursor [Pirellulales bacterium]|nr:NHLP leader peptide family RiPP precursor [Pirellulales bacterium]
MQATLQQGNWQKQWGMLVARAWSDDEFKQRLKDDPAAVLEQEGIDVPLGVRLNVVEDTDEVCHLVLPPSPAGDLIDEELTASIGFDSFSGGCGLCGCGGCGCGCRRCGCFGDDS